MEEGEGGQWGIMGEEGRKAVLMSSRGGTQGTARASLPPTGMEPCQLHQAGREMLAVDRPVPSCLAPRKLVPSLGKP